MKRTVIGSFRDMMKCIKASKKCGYSHHILEPIDAEFVPVISKCKGYYEFKYGDNILDSRQFVASVIDCHFYRQYTHRGKDADGIEMFKLELTMEST